MSRILYKKPMGATEDALQAHVECHLEEFLGACRCDVCQIAFVQSSDGRQKHSAKSNAHCGFLFDHLGECTGRHPPFPGLHGPSSNDRMRLWCGVQSWELVQIQTFVHDVDEAIKGIGVDARSCYSHCRGPVASVDSLSTMLSHLIMNSTPATVDYYSQLDLATIRLNMSRRFAAALCPSHQTSIGRRAWTLCSQKQPAWATCLRPASYPSRGRHSRWQISVTQWAATPLTLAAANEHADMVSTPHRAGAQFDRLVYFPAGHAASAIAFVRQSFAAMFTNTGHLRERMALTIRPASAIDPLRPQCTLLRTRTTS